MEKNLYQFVQSIVLFAERRYTTARKAQGNLVDLIVVFGVYLSY